MSADGYFGLCPTCHKTDGYINVGRSHWFLCDEHKVKWLIGANLFSSWRHESEEDQRKIYYDRGVDKYKEVEPFYSEPTEEERRRSADYEALKRRCAAIDRGYGVKFVNGEPIACGPEDFPF
jgi:hypothetical protein